MAEAVTPAARRDDGAARAGGGGARPGRSAHAPKFALLIGALAGIAIGAVALAAVLIADGHGKGSAGWSAWRPGGDGASAAQQVANHVGPEYRLPNGRQLVLVTGGALKIANLPAHVAKRATNGATSILEGNTVLFTLCGEGSHCSVPGAPSGERAMLLHREGLELALYAFRYLRADMVVELLPPSYPLPAATASTTTAAAAKPRKVRVKAQSTAMFLRRADFADVVSHPLDETLPPPTPTVQTIAHAPEAALIDAVERNAVFGVRFVEAQDASAVVLLEPLT